ncbi:glycosyltransferase [Bacteroidales bacterium OttesenSCG-928-M06]|nr:glycosyltransferase [Bacteroidales bacterium OttesenSCG-928-M06]
MTTSTSHIKNGEYNLLKSEELKKIITQLNSDYVFLYLHSGPIEWGEYAENRMLQVAMSTGAGMVYSDYYKIKSGNRFPNPVLDYQEGCLRDDFDFGPVILYKVSVLKQAVSRINNEYLYASLYALRLNVSQITKIIHINEFLYTELERDYRLSGEKQFDYVNPRNREVQIEMELACTAHLKDIKAWLKPVFKSVDFKSTSFPVEASVIIPVKNREKTIEDAVRSALTQKTDFPFNVIVVDNYSTDDTTRILQEISKKEEKLIHLIPAKEGLGIGGCWNEAITSKYCGKFAIQLDSDDLYINSQTLSKIVEAFYEQQTAMVIGSYKIVNKELEDIPPGLIDHKEWTPENGRNNALRINGLGAPRAFFTPIIREIKFPNTSYGEDYAVALAISRQYQIGRIYDPLYLCRRWEGNSDANLDINKLNMYNHYKDSLRTQEIFARQHDLSSEI